MDRRALETTIETDEQRDALAVVLAQADEHGTVGWADVREDLTGGQWGRLIESGVLIDGYNGGFVLDDPDAVRAALDSAEPDPDPKSESERGADDPTSADAMEPPEEPTTAAIGGVDDGAKAPTWSGYDKVAAVGAVGLMGFEMTGHRTVIGQLVNGVIGPLETYLPFYGVVIVLAIALGVYSTVLQSRLMDMEFIGHHQRRMNDLQERRKAAQKRDDEAALERIREEQTEAMGGQMRLMKAQFRPMVWIVLLTIPAYLWMYWMVGGHVPTGETAVILPLVGQVSLTDAVLGPVQAWLVWYFLCSIASRQVIRKVLGVRTSPSAAANQV